MQLPNNKCKIICYADDLCIKAPTLQDMQTILNQISTLTKELGLIVSISKTKFLATQDDSESLTFDEQPLESCSSYSYLGITTPPPVEFVKTLCQKLSQRLRPLRVLVVGSLRGSIVQIVRKSPNLAQLLFRASRTGNGRGAQNLVRGSRPFWISKWWTPNFHFFFQN